MSCEIGHYVKIEIDDVFGIKILETKLRIKCNPKNFNRLGYGTVLIEEYFSAIIEHSSSFFVLNFIHL